MLENIDWQTSAAVASATIALCALGLTIWQAREIRKHNKLSLLPHIITWSSRDYVNHDYSTLLINNGLGPALITEFQVLLDSEPVVQDEDGLEVIERALKKIFDGYAYSSHHANIVTPHMLPAGAKIVLARVEFNGDKAPSKADLAQRSDRVNVLVRYRSIYGDEFQWNTRKESNT